MLHELSIRNLAVIENMKVRFSRGFQVLTGETGAGKSIVIDALGLIIGGRGSADLVRHNSDRAEIEALFDLPAGHHVYQVLDRLGVSFDEEEMLLIRRDLTNQGKSTARVNGQLVNLTMLREIGACLVNIHGQHEHQSLLNVEHHIRLLDLFGDAAIHELLKIYRQLFDAYSATLKQLETLQQSSKQTWQRIDLYRFQVEEITAAALQLGEDEQLLEEKKRLSGAEKLMDAVSSSYEQIYGGTGLTSIAKAMKWMEDAASIDPQQLMALLEQIQSAYYQLEDVAHQLREYRDQIEFNPARLDEIEQRLDTIAMLRRKYGGDVNDILLHLDKIKTELEQFENKDERLVQLQEQITKEQQQLIAAAGKLSTAREQTADRLALKLEQELRELQMERTKFNARIHHPSPEEVTDAASAKSLFAKNGWDAVEFLISANPGEPLRPLQKIASGGELSRIMLALKSIFSEMEQIPVLIFDEVDTGVSGRAAQAIAEKLSRLSRGCQVFSITHLPQVACMADGHYLIRKEVEGERTFTQVKPLDRHSRVEELARMLGGVEVTGTTLRHAEEMIRLAEEQKLQLQ